MDHQNTQAAVIVIGDDALSVAVQAAIALTGIPVKNFGLTRDGDRITVSVNGAEPVIVEAELSTQHDMELLALEVAAKLGLQVDAVRKKAKANAVPQLARAKSSSIAEFGYGGGALFVRFVAGKLYRYDGVTAEEFALLRNATSIGKQMAITITPRYKGVVVEEHEPA